MPMAGPSVAPMGMGTRPTGMGTRPWVVGNFLPTRCPPLYLYSRCRRPWCGLAPQEEEEEESSPSLSLGSASSVAPGSPAGQQVRHTMLYDEAGGTSSKRSS